jgi:ferrochelatase
MEGMADARKLLVLVNLGTPKAPTPEAVRDFLLEFLSDPGVIDVPRWLWQQILRKMVLRSRPERVAELYRSIWLEEGSPLEVGTRNIAEGVRRLLGVAAEPPSASPSVSSASPPSSVAPPDPARFPVSSTVPSAPPGPATPPASAPLTPPRSSRSSRGMVVEVAWAYRYGEPSLASIFRERVGPATEDVAVLPLYAHHTSSTSGSVFLEAGRIATEMGGFAAKLRRVELPPDAPGFIEALADRCRAAFQGAGFEPDHLLVSYHGIPTRYDRREAGRYSRECRTTTGALLAALDLPPERATHCYQSKFGPEPWLKPATAALLEELPARGVGKLAVVTPGFFTEGLETIEEIGIRGREAFEEAGGKEFLRVPAAGAHPALLRALLEAAYPGS